MIRRLNFKVPITIVKQKHGYYAYSPTLNISASGADLKEVEDRFADLMEEHFEDMLDGGDFDTAFDALGWEKRSVN